MSSDRLTGLDSSFLHLERGPAHMHVASTTVFEGPTPEYDELLRAHRLAPAPGAPLPPEAAHGAPRPGAPEVGRRPAVQPPLPHPPHRAARPRAARSSCGSSPRGSSPSASTARSRCGRCGWWTRSRAVASRSSTKSHHALVDGVSGVDITTVLFDAAPEPESVSRPRAVDAEARAQRRAGARRGAGRARHQPGRDRPRRPGHVPRAPADRARRDRRRRGRRRLRPHGLRRARARRSTSRSGPTGASPPCRPTSAS